MAVLVFININLAENLILYSLDKFQLFPYLIIIIAHFKLLYVIIWYYLNEKYYLWIKY